MIIIDKHWYQQHQDSEDKFDFYVHDDHLMEIDFDFFNKTIVLTCKKMFPQEQQYVFLFQDVIDMHCTIGDFWGNDYVFYDMIVESDAQKNLLYLTSFDALEKKPEQFVAMEDYIRIWFGLLSGDTMTIICKRMIINHQSGDGSKPLKK